MDVRELTEADLPALTRFFDQIPEGDRTFFKEDIGDPSEHARWVAADARGRRFVAVDGDDIAGYVAVVPLTGWSAHVGEVRLVVDPARRGQGVGRTLARRALLASLELDLTKTYVEVVADQVPAVGMFQAIGFEAEALLKGHVRTRDGELRDLIVLAHSVDATWEGMATAGFEDALTST